MYLKFTLKNRATTIIYGVRFDCSFFFNFQNCFRLTSLSSKNITIKMPRRKRQVIQTEETDQNSDSEQMQDEIPESQNDNNNPENEEEDLGEEVNIPADPLEDFDLPENFFVPKIEENLGVGKLGEPRLMIHHITNENFKSYQGKVILGPFHQNFSSVIGPNGSGKSNVIDSLLFVFTFKASKIRLKKLSNLIHFSNSVKKNPPTSCTVTIHFQTVIDDVNNPGGAYQVVPGSEFAISRTAFKDNTSVYKVDGKKKTVKQIKARLKEEGIDLEHNRFLILQGEVEQIALMKPKALTEHDEGMLEYLEDIIGTNRYKEPVEKLKEHTDALSTMRQTKLERVTQMEGEVEELRGARNDAMLS